MKKTGTYAGTTGAATGAAAISCIGRVANTNAALPSTSSTDTGTDKTMCYSKATPALAATTPVETGYPLAFVTAATSVITTQSSATTATKWKTAMELNRAADETAVKAAIPITGTGAVTAAVKAE